MFKTDETMLKFRLSQIVSKGINVFLQNEISKVDYFFAMALVADHDKLDF